MTQHKPTHHVSCLYHVQVAICSGPQYLVDDVPAATC